MKSHYVILDPKLLPKMVFTRVRDVLSEYGGVRLYRNGFRVVPYGDPGNDWLRLDEAQAKRSVLAPISNRNFFGVVEIHDVKGLMFDEHTSREGLIESASFVELRDLTSSVLVTAVTRISEDRGKRTNAGKSRPEQRPEEDSENPVSAIAGALREIQESAEKAAADGPVDAAQIAARIGNVVQLAEKSASAFNEARANLADEANMLRFLATLGMTSAEFSHETGMTFDAFRLDFEKIFDFAMKAGGEDAIFAAQAERASKMLQRLDSLTSYLNTLASARAVRYRSPVSLTKAIDDFQRAIRSQASTQAIEFEVITPDYDPLFTLPMHQAEVASILLNLYTNSVKAIKRKGEIRRIRVSAARTTDGANLVIRFCDSGDGVPKELRERIFDAFFTTSVAPPAGAEDSRHATGTGLGLWIVHQIVENAAGTIVVVGSAEGFGTCIEITLPAERDQ